jgi:hypothetical protein
MTPTFLNTRTVRSFFRFIIPFLFFTGLALAGLSQSSHETNIVWLNNGDTLYSHELHFHISDLAEKYLLLDNQRQVNIRDVNRYRGRHGTFVVLPGSAGPDLYRVIREGPRISAYSRTIYEAEPDTNGVHPTAYYYRKAGQQQMTLLTYHGLLHAMQDNPGAQVQLRLTKTQFIGGIALSFVSAVVTAVGFHEMFKRSANQPLQLPNPSGQLSPLPGTKVAPLAIIGSAGFVGGMVIAFTAHRHEKKAFDIYNQ